MKHVLAHRRGTFLFAGAILVLAGIAWGAAYRPHARTPLAAADRTAPAQTSQLASPAQPIASAKLQSSVQAQGSETIVPVNVAMQSGMKIYRDPETGEVSQPTREILAQTASSVPEDVSDLVQVTLPDGSVMVDLKGKYQESMIVQLDKHGKRVSTCTTDPEEAFKHAPVEAPVVAPAPQREDR